MKKTHQLLICAAIGLALSIPLYLSAEVHDLRARIDQLEAQEAEQSRDMYVTDGQEWSA